MTYVGSKPTNVPLTSADIEDGVISAADLGANSVDSSELVDGSVDNSHMSVNSIDSDQYVDGSIDTAHIADDQITLAKMASGTDGNIISYDASGNPVAIATGSDGEVLTSAGAGQPPAFEAVSAGVSLSGSTNNTVATVTGANALIGEANLTFDGTTLSGVRGYFNQTNSGGGTEVLKLRKTTQFSEPAIRLVQYENSSTATEHDTMLIHGHRYYGTGSNETLCINNKAAGGIQFDIGGVANSSENTAMEIGSGKTVGIGTTPDTTQLKVQTTTDGEKIMQLRHGDADNPTGIEIQYYGGAPDSSDDYFLHCADSSATRLVIDAQGDVRNDDNSYGQSSDERIKQGIKDANSQWDDIKALRVRNFTKKSDVRQYGENAWEQIGLVAQEAELVSPKLIKECEPNINDILSDGAFGTLVDDTDHPNEDGTFPKKVGEVTSRVKAIKYSVLYMKAIKALQEAQTRIETLETANTDLATRITALENA